MGEERARWAALSNLQLNFIVEGQTEETFVNRVLKPHLANRTINTSVRCVLTSKKNGHEYRGGIGTYQQARRDILLWMEEEQNADTRFTTMFDLYRMPKDFPQYKTAAQLTDPYERVKALEAALQSDLGVARIIPYIQLHEFESLVLADAAKLSVQFPNYPVSINNIVAMTGTFKSPELIDDSDGPAKRISTEIPEYEYRKAAAGPIVAEHIGLPTLRTKCTHFGCWIGALESLAHPGVEP